MLAIFGDTKYNKFSNTKFEGTCVYGICRTKPAAGGLPAMRRPGWLSCARGRGAVLRGMRASARAVFAAGTSEIEKKKAGNVLTNITCLCFHYTIDEYGVSSLRKGRKCERNPSGVSFAFNSRAQATVCAADRFRSNKKRHAETVVLLSKGEIDSKKVRVEFSLEDMDMSGFQKGATYEQIKAYVLEHTGLKVSSLYISQIKRKCGLDVGQNYNLSKKEDAKVPKCPPEKEAAIRDALKYFQMI